MGRASDADPPGTQPARRAQRRELTASRSPGPLPRLERYRESRTRGDAMTTLTQRGLAPDKRAAEMSDSDDAAYASKAALAQGGQSADDHGAGRSGRPPAGSGLGAQPGRAADRAGRAVGHRGHLPARVRAPADQDQLSGPGRADQRPAHRRRHHRADAADAGARAAPPQAPGLPGRHRAARLRYRHPLLPFPVARAADTDGHRRADLADRAAVLPGRVLRRGGSADPVAGHVGVRRAWSSPISPSG